MMVISCKTCRWIGCRNYGWDRQTCMKYIPETAPATTDKIGKEEDDD